MAGKVERSAVVRMVVIETADGSACPTCGERSGAKAQRVNSLPDVVLCLACGRLWRVRANDGG